MTRWLVVSLLSKFQGSRSWRRQPKSHSCRPLRKLLKPRRPRRFRELKPESSGITPVCQVAQTGHVEELVEVSRVFSQDTVQQRFGKQSTEIPAESDSPTFVTAPILENSPVEYMKPALTVTCAHAAPVVENATVQLPQEIVYEHPAPLTGGDPEGTEQTSRREAR